MLSQQVLLSLLQQLGYDLSREPVTKLSWISDAALALNLQVWCHLQMQSLSFDMLSGMSVTK